MYNGWTNYETWAVALWMGNDYNESQYWHDRAREWASLPSTSKHWTQEESARFNLADEIKEAHQEAASDAIETASVFSDLLGAALSDVNWQEIAEHWLADVEPVQ